jgi:hypothetical protein
VVAYKWLNVVSGKNFGGTLMCIESLSLQLGVLAELASVEVYMRLVEVIWSHDFGQK